MADSNEQQRYFGDYLQQRVPTSYDVLLGKTLAELCEDNSYKVLVSIFLQINKNHDLRKFAIDLISRPHDEYGNYLNIFFIILHYKGSKETADTIAREFRKKGVTIIPVRRNYEPTDHGRSEGAGEGAVLTYNGKTYVRFADGPEGEFYLSGVPPGGTHVPKTGSTSVIFVSKKSQPRKMFRLDFDTLKRGPNKGQKGWEYNQEGVQRVLGLTISNHDPAKGIAKLAGPAIRLYKWGGRFLFLTDVTNAILEIYNSMEKGRAILTTIAGLAGAAAVAARLAVAGAKSGKELYGLPGAVIGGLLSGMAGGYIGARLASAVADWGYCRLFTPVESEEWIIVEMQPDAALKK